MKKRILEYNRNSIEIKELSNEIEALKDDKYGVSSVNISGMPKGSGISNPTQSQVDKNLDIDTKIDDKIKRLNELKKDKVAVIQFLGVMKRKLSDLEYQVILYKYISGKKNKEVCKKLGITAKSLENKRYNALSKIVKESKGNA